MKDNTLYVSDLDGTLLRSDQTISEYTNQVINDMTDKGMLFSYATARSVVTAKKVTNGFVAKIPLIVYNGAFIIDNHTGKILAANYFNEDIYALLQDLFECKVYPIVYAYINGVEKFSYIEKKSSKGMLEFIATRNDSRKRPVEDEVALSEGNCFYITCIESPEKLFPLYEKYKERYHCVYQRDIYSGEQWLEIMPKETSKASAILKLKKMLNCNRVIAFGDGVNDMELFHIADECYAVENAVPELKQIATGVIGGNNEDGVAKWLKQHL
ncbi:MAG: HAD family hydrolase [Lachnospiraceae bacterium]